MSTREPEGPTDGGISPATVPGVVELTVSDLDRSLAYYQEAVGLEVAGHADGVARLGTAERDLLHLIEEPGARPGAGYTGLYHFALLVPTRADLAGFLAHLARERVELIGLSDHFVSESIYLSDPDGHGIEVYADRPRSHWEGQVAARMTTIPLDVDGLLSELENPTRETFESLPAGTVMGHIHLKVAAIPETVAFYRDLLGFAVMAKFGDSAAFLSAGGYHHHIGANTWESAGASPPPAGTAALRQASFVLVDEQERERVLAHIEAGATVDRSAEDPIVRDPSGIALALAVQ